MPDQTAIHQKTPSATRPVIITSQTITDEVTAFFRWWYIEIPIWYVGVIQRIAVICDNTLSISLLLKTFFISWHRDKSWIGHLFGITTRLLYLPVALLITIAVLGFLILVAVTWALVPPLATYFIIRTPFL